jgi:hypothetical protein
MTTEPDILTTPPPAGSGDPLPSTTSPADTPDMPDLPPEEGRVRRWLRDRRVRLAAGYVAIVTTTAWLYGVLPLAGRSFPLAPHASMASWADCLEAGSGPCRYIGYPQGVDLSLSAALAHGTYLVTRLGVGVEEALNLQAVLALAVGVAALWALAASIARSTAAGPIAVAVYYLSPIVVTQTSKLSLWIGYLLVPVPVAAAYFAASSSRRSLRVALGYAAAALVSALLLVYLDPYSWAIAAVVGGAVCLGGGVAAVVRRHWLSGLVLLLTLVALLVPGAIFRTNEPSAEISADFPPEFYRAYGADLATTVIPTRDSLFGEVIRAPVERWDPTEFYGDGTNLPGAFMGGFLFLGAAAGAVWLLRRRGSNRLLVLALGVGGVACLALGLGPSLKLLDRAPVSVTADGFATGSDHFMPASDATVATPWSWVYGIQPFEGMRAAYRWHVGLRLVLAVLAGAAVVWLFRRRRVLGVVAAALLLLETGSHNLFDLREQATRDHELVQRFEHDIDRAFGDGRLRASERVLFLPAGNDYLIGMIAPRFEVFSYNIAFDKEITRLRPGQPRPVVAAINAYWDGTLTRDHVCELFRQDLADAVVFNDFDMRWDTLRWPPAEERLEAHRNQHTRLGLFDDPAFDVDDGYLAVILRPDPDAAEGCQS